MKLRNWNSRVIISLVLLLTVIMWDLPIQEPVYAAGETAVFGVEGYISGAEWNISQAKALTVNVNSLTTNTGGYKIRITLAKGMRLES